ncbi:hypothetical protein [Streptococcus pneumoniae]|uniref:hypothetical protein n=1 Tax=Streptococcus pneumoniae TaxID=1313 RepID=UPI0011567351|nr:hypothetical protein [Streptococcus pneumoniae]
MKIKEQTRKLVTSCSKHRFEDVDRTDERKLVTSCSKHCFEVVDKTDKVSSKHRFEVGLTKSVTYIRQGDVDVV